MAKQHKYRAKKTAVDGITFDSKKEATRYSELKLLEKAGEIKDLRLQVKFELIPKLYTFYSENYKRRVFACEWGTNYSPKSGWVCIQREMSYVADFIYKEKGEDVLFGGVKVGSQWKEIIEDVKGFRTQVYKKKKKLMKIIHNVEIREV